MTFAEFCQSHGIICPKDIPLDRWTPCATEAKPRGKSASVKLTDGGTVGFAHDHASMTRAELWRAKDTGARKKRDMEAEDAARREREAIRAKEEAEGTARAVKLWTSAEELKMAAHPYVEKKRLTMQGASGLRVIKCALLIPMKRGERLISLQRIEADGTKKFASGAPSKGTYYWIHRKNPVASILCEGWATAMTLAEAVPMVSVCVSFSAANMIEVAKLLEWSGLCAVASDNDHEKPCPWCLKRGEHLQNPPNQPRPEQCRCNPGFSSALEAAKIIGCGVALPPAREGATDFNDWFCAMLAEKEKAVEAEKWKPHISKLRREACAPIYSAVMGAARMVK